MLKDWGTETVFINPPYSQCEEWMRKAYGAAQEGATVVCLVPSRTDTEWWHRFAMKGEIRLLKGRLKFGDAVNSAPFPSAVIVFRPREFVLTAWDARDV
jgi:site-specific DNA-methyltransferase (adenine-specific)